MELTMNDIHVGYLVEFSYKHGKKALGYVTERTIGRFKAYWSDEGGNESHWMTAECITNSWKVIDYTDLKTKEEAKMTNVNKHGVDYSAIEIGDLVKLDMGFDGTILGYVTKVTDSKLHAIWSDDFGEWHESFSTGKICGHWKVVVHEPKKLIPTKPYEQLIAYESSLTGKLRWGVFTHKKGNKYYVHFSDSNKGFLFEWNIADVVDIVVHPSEKKPFFKEGDTVVVTSMRPIDTERHREALGLELTVTGYGSKDEYYGQWYRLKHSTEGNYIFPDCNLTLKEDLENLSAAQEASTFGYTAIQGIVSANEDKNEPIYVDVPLKLKMTFTREKYLQYGKDCYLQGQEDTEKRMISQNTLELAKEKAYSEGISFAQTEYLKSFTFSDFDLSVMRTWKKQDFKDAVSNAALGLTGEAGEVADLIKKAIYHGRGFSLKDNPKAIAKYDVLDELSDVLFYVSAMAQEFGFTLEEVAKHNRKKLEKRFPEGFSTEASAQKVDKAPEVKPDGEIRIGYVESYKEDTLEYVGVDKAPFSTTYFSTDYDLKKTLKELRDGSRVTIEDKHKGEFKFTRVGDLIRVHFKDLEGNLDSHTCLVKVSYEEVTN